MPAVTGAVTAEAVVDAQGDHVDVLADPIVEYPKRHGSATENELFAFPIHRWSYSTPKDQFGAKPYSNPTPKVPPQRVAVAATRPPP